MSKKNDKPIIVNLTIIGKFINEFNKLNKFTSKENFYINSIFFKALYKERKKRSLLKENEIEIMYLDFKNLLKIFVGGVEVHFLKEISIQKTYNLFLKNIGYINLTEETKLCFCNLTIDCTRKSRQYILKQCSPLVKKSNKIANWSIQALYRFLYGRENKNVPLEIILILVSDAQKIYFNNKEFFTGTSIFNSFHMELALFCQLKQSGNEIVEINGEFFILNNIPRKNDPSFQVFYFIDKTSFSIPFLMDYFGNESWYDTFFPDFGIGTDYIEFDIDDY